MHVIRGNRKCVLPAPDNRHTDSFGSNDGGKREDFQTQPTGYRVGKKPWDDGHRKFRVNVVVFSSSVPSLFGRRF